MEKSWKDVGYQPHGLEKPVVINNCVAIDCTGLVEGKPNNEFRILMEGCEVVEE